MAHTLKPTDHDAEVLDTAQLQATLASADPGLRKEFYEIFLGHVGAELEQLATAQTDAEQLSALAHQLKSSSQSVGARRFTRSLLELESIARRARPDPIALRRALNNVIATWAETTSAVRQQMAALSES